MCKERFRVAALAAVAACLLISAITVFGGQAVKASGKPTTNPKVRLMMATGFDISDDGGGAYTDGVDGVEAQIHTDGTNDMTLLLGGSRNPRKFNITHTFLGCGGAPDSCSSVPNGTFTTGYWINIRQIGNMAPDTTRWTRAHIATSGLKWGFNWCRDLTPITDVFPPTGVTLANITRTCDGSDFLVSVYRSSATDFTVSTSDLDHDPSSSYVAPISELIESSGRSTISHGMYRTSFKFQIHILP